jgi:Thioesterase-like superfamily
MSGGRFAAATSITPLGDGRYQANLDGEFSVAGRLNGGYLLGVLARAAQTAVGWAGGPLAATVHYLSPPEPGPAEAAVSVARAGRSAHQVRAQLWQGDVVRAEAFFTLGRSRASTASGDAWSDSTPVDLPPPSACFRMPVQPPGAPFRVPLMGVIEEWLDPAVLGFTRGEPVGAGQLRGWVRIPGEPAVDPVGLLLVADALPPAVFDLGHIGWVPTLELTVHVTALPRPGALRVRQQVHVVLDGLLSQVCDIWDTGGRLVAHAIQLAGLPGPLPERPASAGG